MHALKGVWASKYNDRAYFSLRKVKKKWGHLRPLALDGWMVWVDGMDG